MADKDLKKLERAQIKAARIAAEKAEKQAQKERRKKKKLAEHKDLKDMPIPEGAHLLELDNLKMYFHTQDGVVKAVDGVTYTLDKGETLGVVSIISIVAEEKLSTSLQEIKDPYGIFAA